MEKKKELGEGREGDWDCNGCRNRNYAFRSFCNRCKQPRIFVDTKTPSDSKWLPRIGDWICSGCTNNNYASREKCKKCGQPKEIAAMPAIPIPDASLQTYANYFARIQVGPRPKMSMGFMGHFGQHSVPSNPHWSFGGVDRYGLPTAANFTFGGNNRDEFLHIGDGSILQMAPKGWRSGDWICNCGFHNYSSRSQCKKCNAFPSSGGNQATGTHLMSDFFPALGTKRLASEEFSEDWDNKRLNSGDNNHFTENEKQHLYQTFEHRTGSSIEQTGTYGALNFQMHAMSPQLGKTVPTFIGKGAKQWRDGDWMCTNCNNHNFASRTHCNRCELQKDIPDQTVTVT